MSSNSTPLLSPTTSKHTLPTSAGTLPERGAALCRSVCCGLQCGFDRGPGFRGAGVRGGRTAESANDCAGLFVHGLPFFFHPSTMFFSPSLFFPPSKPSFFTLKNHFLPTLWNLFFHPAPCHFHPVACFFHPSPCFFHPLPFLFHPRPFLFNPPPAKQVTPGTCAENDVTSG